MLDFAGVQRDELKLALGAAIGIGAGTFLTSTDELTSRVIFALLSAVLEKREAAERAEQGKKRLFGDEEDEGRKRYASR